MADDWDDSSSDDDATAKKPAPSKPTKKPAAEWSESSSDEAEPADKDKTVTSPQSAPTANAQKDDLDSSDDDPDASEPTDDSPTKSTDTNNTASPDNASSEKVFTDAEQLAKLAKKMQNFKRKQKKKKKRKKKPPPPKPQSNDARNLKTAKSKGDDSDSSSSSDSSDSDAAAKGSKSKKKRAMQTYDERMQTDNDILFEGQAKSQAKAKESAEARQARLEREKAEERKKAEAARVMLSGEVTLKNFPLGSGRDCENLAGQVVGAIDQKLFEEAITENDVFLFYNKLLSADLLERLDMVDTKALTNKLNVLLQRKQKAWHKKKNPKGKKKKLPQWIVSDKRAKTTHRDGDYNQDEYSLFDM